MVPTVGWAPAPTLQAGSLSSLRAHKTPPGDMQRIILQVHFSNIYLAGCWVLVEYSDVHLLWCVGSLVVGCGT